MNHTILFIGIIEENDSRCILDITRELFIQSDYEVVYESINGDVIGFYNGSRTLIMFDLIIKDLNMINFNNFNFDILVHSYIDDFTNPYINNLIKKSKICILNGDDENLVPLYSNLEDIIAITYGFNSKSTLTVSSYNLNPTIAVNLCLQRDLSPVFGEKIEPFEFSLELTSENESYIYPVLAASTLTLIVGETIFNKKPYETIIVNY